MILAVTEEAAAARALLVILSVVRADGMPARVHFVVIAIAEVPAAAQAYVMVFAIADEAAAVRARIVPFQVADGMPLVAALRGAMIAAVAHKPAANRAAGMVALLARAVHVAIRL